MSMEDVGPIPYTVTSQHHTQELTPAGRFIDVMEVHFRGPSGVDSHVTVPLDQYHPETVDALIQSQLQRIESVHRLGDVPGLS